MQIFKKEKTNNSFKETRKEKMYRNLEKKAMKKPLLMSQSAYTKMVERINSLPEDQKIDLLKYMKKRKYASYTATAFAVATIGLALKYGADITGSLGNLTNTEIVFMNSFKEFMLNTTEAVKKIASLAVLTGLGLYSKSCKKDYKSKINYLKGKENFNLFNRAFKAITDYQFNKNDEAIANRPINYSQNKAGLVVEEKIEESRNK